MSNKKVVVLGAGESGLGAAILAKKKGYQVFVSDSGKIKKQYRAQLQNAQISFEEGKHTVLNILDADIVVKSPGIPNHINLVQQIINRGIELISEVEWASRFTNAYLIAITGTNGKTTTTSLIYHLLQQNRLNVGVAGNIGNSFALAVAEQSHEYYVLEVSSFQLDDIVHFRPNIAVLTNITPDHLDRYDYSMQKYAQAKFRITENQTENDFFVYCLDDKQSQSSLTSLTIQAKQHPFSIDLKSKNGAYIYDESIVFGHLKIQKNNLPLLGKHNLYNTMAAITAAKLVGLSTQQITSALASFQPIEHRIEPVSTINNVLFINDSKATNVEAVWYALDAMTQPTILILGGIDKGNDYTILLTLIQQKVKAIICLGKNNSKIVKAFSKIIPIIKETESVNEAIQQAWQLSNSGDVVLLSPACSSFDLFNDYTHRGRSFKQAVYKLQQTIRSK